MLNTTTITAISASEIWVIFGLAILAGFVIASPIILVLLFNKKK